MKKVISLLLFTLLGFHTLFAFTDDPVPAQEQDEGDVTQKSSHIAKRFVSDHGGILSSPFHWKWEDWLLVGGLAATTVVLINNDESIYRQVKSFQKENPFVDQVSPILEGFCKEGPIGVGALFLLHGLLAGNKKSLDTGSLTLQAILHSFVVIQGIKHLSGRQRPSWEEGVDRWVGPSGFFKRYEKGQWARYDAFASGHTINIWSMATVVAHQYNETPWVPIICYTTATLGGLSTMTEDLHWLSDVVVGAALGFAIGKYVVKRHQTKWTLLPTLPAKGGLALSLQVNW